ncbi:phosphate ABC transporter membrane protein 1 (PhoT family) [Keratinibaculum paraultunense]|uniref:Phosphate transport system permease protein n=1 Tax=Keratinibaculum paraultunense TaxID=1278232 RepID=A0A4R3KTL4_9FIRM|nr:phosphate ABC transporter permease subunit PstC [Keratinibaculum paraultunense]QQY79799.1 phosphate ABC transporter permease subunit PstC [Keratinibaculum paraultunense]TCS88679.1 phosphate ABC transporter membrane protein 1 (PhoT family) [Keratinibaculum paraultunense]
MKTKFLENFMRIIFFISATVSIISIILICIFIFAGGIPFLKEYGFKNFFLGVNWKPNDTPPSYGILPMILGSIYVTIGAIIIGVPIGVLTATYLAKFCNKKIYKFLKSSINLMAGIPSIIYGFFALVVIVPIIRNIFGGTGMSILTASILLGIMILPTIINISEAAIRAVPKSYYEGSIALGASHEQSVISVVLPAAKSGILSSIILGIGRAIGETMAVILVAGNQARIPSGITEGVRTLTANIVIEMAYAADEHRQALIATATILFAFILIINGLFLLVKRRRK